MEKELIKQKPRFVILDGLRGVAALIVVAFHLFESYSKGPALQIINHGYLAVDFFFALSGFVLGYAYDDRWGRGMTVGNFLLRRLIRLQPMVLMGVSIGALLYYFGLGNIETTTVGSLLAVWVLGCLMIPTTAGMDIRGWGEGYALDGPQWSLGFEYVANLLYCTVVRFFPNWLLALFVGCAALLSVDVTLNVDLFGFLAGRESHIYTLIGGWSLDPEQLYVGFTRLLYPFFAGLLVYRFGLRIRVKGAFVLTAVIIAVVLMMPRVGISDYHWTNGLYELVCVLIVFPVVVMMGAGSGEPGKRTGAVCEWLGRISYPLYITHYPLIYMQFNWALKHPDMPISAHVFVGIACFVLSLGVAVACERLYDAPVRSWLTKKFLIRQKRSLK